MAGWNPGWPGVVELPGGYTVCGASHRAARRLAVEADLVMLLRYRPPRAAQRPCVWIRWPDFGLPTSPDLAVSALRGGLELAAQHKVLISCPGGLGRTGTALGVLAILSGVAPAQAVTWVRRNYHRRAVETRRQARWLESLESTYPRSAG